MAQGSKKEQVYLRLDIAKGTVIRVGIQKNEEKLGRKSQQKYWKRNQK